MRFLTAVFIASLVLCLPGVEVAAPANPPPGVRTRGRHGLPVAGRVGRADAIEEGNGGTGVGTGRGPVRCTSRPGATATAGSSAGDRVALSFDDGPSLRQTPSILATLNRLHAHATFFEEGRHLHGREALMGQILASGDEIGNHSYHHPEYPGENELASTDRAIHAATGFEPCLFRPPYGLIDAKVTAAARRNGLEMILWTLDSEDDHHPGVAAIEANVVQGATPGAIILMHDGGHHPQTVQALPRVIRGLRARGFRFATVTELLGGRMIRRAGSPG